MAAEDVEVVKAVVVCRHGARYPSTSAFRRFENTPVGREWDILEELSPLGEDQMFQMGKYLAERYRYLLGKRQDAVRWRSSTASRVVSSGVALWRGFESRGREAPELEPYNDPSRGTADEHYRTWSCDKRYTTAAKKLLACPLMRQKAAEEDALLRRVTRLGGSPYSSASPAPNLTNMTYYWEILECEKHDPERRALQSKIKIRDQVEIERLARWVWDKRFFHHHAEWKHILGARLLQEVVEDLSTGDSLLSVYTGHDYSILSLLCSLGMAQYPAGILGYGAHLIFEVCRARDSGESTVRVRLNATPFIDVPNGHSIAEEVQAVWDTSLDVPFLSPTSEDGVFVCSLSTLEAHAASLDPGPPSAR